MTILDEYYADGVAAGVAKGEAIGVAKGLAKGEANTILEFMNDGIITPAQARARLMAFRHRGPKEAEAAEAALKIIGNRE